MILELILVASIAQARIEGTVVNSLTAAPVRKVEISIDAREGDKHYSVDTTADGKFVIENIDPGEYRMTAKRFGYLEKKGDDLHLDATSDLKQIAIKVAPAGVIAGRVVDEDGDPVPYEGVDLGQRFHRNSESRNADGDGHFVFGDLKPGRYTLSVLERYARIDDVTRLYVLAEPPSPIDIKPGSEFRDVEIRLRRIRVHKVRGKLSELPAESLSMVLIQSGTDGISRSARTGPDGSFEFKAVPAGSYSIQVNTNARDVDRATGNINLKRSPFYFNFPIIVGDRDLEGIVVPVGPPASLSVKFIVLGSKPELLPHVNLEYGPTILTPTETLTDGTLHFTKLAWDEYFVNLAVMPDNCYIKSMQLDRGDVVYRLDLHSGGDHTLEIVIAPNAAQITAPLRDGAIAHLWRDDGTGTQNWLPQNGQVKFENVAPGEYHLLAWENGTDFNPDDPETQKNFATYIATVTVAEGEHARVDLKVIPNPQP